MDYHLDYGLHLETKPEYKSLYAWAINEVGANNSRVGRDLIPWAWTLYFSATTCSLTNRLEIERRSLSGNSVDPPKILADQSIRMSLRPGMWHNEKFVSGTTYSMFGTKRVINDFGLEIAPHSDQTEPDHCYAWGSVSYTSEIDFRNETVDDCLWFYLNVKPQVFEHYTNLINQNAVDNVYFSVGSVDGFYSDWSPSISTNFIKVLLPGEEHTIDLPPYFDEEIPRLGKIGKAQLFLQRHLKFADKKQPPL